MAIDIKIQFFRVLVTIEPDRSLLQFVTANCLIELSIVKARRLQCFISCYLFSRDTSYGMGGGINFGGGLLDWKSEVLHPFLRVLIGR